jgi:hypothetical protein
MSKKEKIGKEVINQVVEDLHNTTNTELFQKRLVATWEKLEEYKGTKYFAALITVLFWTMKKSSSIRWWHSSEKKKLHKIYETIFILTIWRELLGVSVSFNQKEDGDKKGA